MDSLEWSQNADGLHVTVTSPTFGRAKFSVGKSLINYLLAGTPRLYFAYVKFMDENDDTVYMLDLTKLRPVISQSNGLKISLNRRESDSLVTKGKAVGRFCIARGESYKDRFLDTKGWQAQRVYHDIVEDSPEVSVSGVTATVSDVKPETPPPHASIVTDNNREIPVNNVGASKPQGKLKVCEYCGEIYPSISSVCPFCNNQGKNKPPQQVDDVDLDLS